MNYINIPDFIEHGHFAVSEFLGAEISHFQADVPASSLSHVMLQQAPYVDMPNVFLSTIFNSTHMVTYACTCIECYVYLYLALNMHTCMPSRGSMRGITYSIRMYGVHGAHGRWKLHFRVVVPAVIENLCRVRVNLRVWVDPSLTISTLFKAEQDLNL